MTLSLAKSDFRVIAGYKTNRLREYDRLDVDRAVAQGMAYVWGWVDAGGTIPRLDGNTAVSWVFGHWYGVQVAEFRAGAITYLPSIQSAWDAWHQAAIKTERLHQHQDQIRGSGHPPEQAPAQT